MRQRNAISVVRLARVARVAAVLALAVLAALTVTPPACAADGASAQAAGAKVVELKGGAEAAASGGSARALRAGDVVDFGEDVRVIEGSSATLALPDNTLRAFFGPVTISIRQGASPSGGTVLGHLTAGVAQALFGGKQRAAEAVLATRSAEAGAEPKASVPALVYPAPGENLLDAPKQFRWVAIEGVPLYRVSVYGANQMMWQGTTSESKAGCPAKTCDFKPGEIYYWVVEALVGNTTLRSQAADFTVLAAEERGSLVAALGEAGASVSDADAAVALKARLCLDSRAYAKALEVIDEAITASPTPSAYVLRGDIKDAMGLPGEALEDYREGLSRGR